MKRKVLSWRAWSRASPAAACETPIRTDSSAAAAASRLGAQSAHDNCRRCAPRSAGAQSFAATDRTRNLPFSSRVCVRRTCNQRGMFPITLQCGLPFEHLQHCSLSRLPSQTSQPCPMVEFDVVFPPEYSASISPVSRTPPRIALSACRARFQLTTQGNRSVASQKRHPRAKRQDDRTLSSSVLSSVRLQDQRRPTAAFGSVDPGSTHSQMLL